MVKPIGPRALEIHRRNAAQACLRGRAVQAGFTVTHLDKSGMWWPSHSRTVPTLSPPPRCYCTSHMADAHSQIAQTQLRCSHAQASCTQPPTRHDAEAQPVRIFRPPDRPALGIKPTLKAPCENLLHLRFALHNLWLGSNCRRREAIDSGRRRIRRAVRGWQLHRQARRRHSVLHTWLRLFHLTVSFFRRNTFRGRALGARYLSSDQAQLKPTRSNSSRRSWS